MSLFVYPQITIDTFKSQYQLDISSAFLACADTQLTESFERLTGLKFSKNLCISWVSEDWFKYIQGDVSSLTFYLYVNHNWNDIEILWQSRSGRIYHIADQDIDCSDIIFSFKHLDIEEYIKQLYPGTKLPFKLKDLTYELEVNRLNMDLQLKLVAKQGENQDAIIVKLNQFLNDFNEASEKRDRKDGVVHHWKCNKTAPATIVYDIDLDSVGFSFLKKLLKHLSKGQQLTTVILE